MYVCMYVCLYACMHVRVYTFVYVCMHARMCVYVCMCVCIQQARAARGRRGPCVIHYKLSSLVSVTSASPPIMPIVTCASGSICEATRSSILRSTLAAGRCNITPSRRACSQSPDEQSECCIHTDVRERRERERVCVCVCVCVQEQRYGGHTF